MEPSETDVAIKPKAPPRMRPLSPQDRWQDVKWKTSYAMVIVCPALLLMPPRKLDHYTFLLSLLFLGALNEQAEQRTGRDIIWHSEAPIRWVRRKIRAGQERQREVEREEMLRVLGWNRLNDDLMEELDDLREKIKAQVGGRTGLNSKGRASEMQRMLLEAKDGKGSPSITEEMQRILTEAREAGELPWPSKPNPQIEPIATLSDLERKTVVADSGRRYWEALKGLMWNRHQITRSESYSASHREG